MAHKIGTPTASNGYTWFEHTNSGSPADGATYYFGLGLLFTNTTDNAACRFVVPKSGTLNDVYGTFYVGTTLGSSENATLKIVKNSSSETTVSSTVNLSSTNFNFSTTGLGISVSAGDWLQWKFTGPTWVTNPTNVSFSATCIIS